ncbi:MAG: hypothetical protein H5T86_15860, partial [Armatimonadetes bacterium]|nr:hypothetical protein [Armatimonadota bacterium]
ETRYDDLDHYVAYDRAPEISFAKHLIPLDSDQSQTQRFTLSLSAGYYREIHERYGKLAAGRFQLTLERDYHTDQRDRLVGQWYGWGARWNKYTTGDDYGILHVYYGRGGRIAPNLAAALTGTYHLCAGTYPLRLDNPDIRVELTPMLDWDITDKWRVRFQARYDVSQEKFRDYTIQLDRQAHCLTWYVRYRDLGNSVAVGVNLSGITGGTRPYSAQPEPPELREGQRVPRPFEPPTGQQEETQKGQQDNGQASESPPQQ